MRLDPVKKAEYFAHLSKGNSATSNTAPLNIKSTSYNKEGLLEESERRHKSNVRKSSKHINEDLIQENNSGRRHRSKHKSSKNETIRQIVTEPKHENDGELRHDSDHKHHHRHRSHSHRHHSHSHRSHSHNSHNSHSRHHKRSHRDDI
jgi:hypothetical protein